MSPQVRRLLSLVIGVLLIILGWLFSDHKGQNTGQSSPEPKISEQSGAPTSGQKPTDPAPSAPRQDTLPIGSGFDFYVVSLSWSPTWCATSDQASGAQQCAQHKGLIMHGFWPQNEVGYPEFCRTSEPDRVPDSLARAYVDLIPSVGLIGHEWRKHGTCSGLSAKDYLATARAAFNAIKIPQALQGAGNQSSMSVDALEQDFVSANSGLQRSHVAVTCQNQMLEEIRICMTKDLKFRACSEVDRNACRLKTVSIPAP